MVSSVLHSVPQSTCRYITDTKMTVFIVDTFHHVLEQENDWIISQHSFGWICCNIISVYFAYISLHGMFLSFSEIGIDWGITDHTIVARDWRIVSAPPNQWQWRAKKINILLTLFSPVPHFYTPWKRQKTFGFLMFSGGIEIWHWTKMG